MPQQVRNVLAPCAQGRDGQWQHVQPIEQILTKMPAFDAVEQFAVGCGHDADVDLHRLAPADRLHDAFLQRAQKLCLRCQGQFADLVEEKRAAMGLDELAGVALGGSGERAFLVAEQDRFHEVVRDRPAIDRDKRLRLALAAAMNGAGEHLLADAGFAFDQDRHRGGGGFLRGAQHTRHRFAARDDIGESQAAFAAVPDALQFALECAGVERVAQANL